MIQKEYFQTLYGNFGIVSALKPQLSVVSNLDENIPQGLPIVVNLINDPINPQVLTSGYIAGEIKSANFKTGETGWLLAPETAEFNVGVSVDSLDIPDTTSANSFHVDSSGNVWWGATLIGSATAKVLNTGIATFNTVTIAGGTFVATDVLLSEQRFNTLFKRYVFIGNYNDALTATAGISRALVLSRLSSTGTDVTLSSGRTHVGSGNTIFSTNNGDFEFIASVQLGAVVTQDAIWGIADDGNVTLPVNSALTSHHFAFIVEDGTLYASNGQGTQQTKTDVSAGITLTDMNTYRIKYDVSESEIYFYINDSLKATHTTNISGATDPSFLFGIDAIAGTKTMDVTNNYMIIHE